MKPGRNPSSQDRGNSGVYIFNNHELQVIDSFALDDENPRNNAIEMESDHKQWRGAKRPQLAKGPVLFQNHRNPVVFRNIWAMEWK